MKKTMMCLMGLLLSACTVCPLDEVESRIATPEWEERILRAAQLQAPCEGIDWEVRIVYTDQSITCDGRSGMAGCYSCFESDRCGDVIQVSTVDGFAQFTLAHELGHMVSAQCGLDWGEYEADRFGLVVLGWVNSMID